MRTGRHRPRPLRLDPVAPAGPAPPVPDLSPQGVRAVARLERDRLWPDAVRQAVLTWTWFVRHPDHPRWDTPSVCGQWECCPTPREARRILDLASGVLPSRDARTLHRHLPPAPPPGPVAPSGLSRVPAAPPGRRR